MATDPELYTDRLILRSLQEDDATEMFHYRADSVTNQYQGWIPETIHDVYDFIRNRVSPAIDLPGTWFQIAIVKRDNGTLIGDIGIHFSDDELSQVEVGCTLSKHEQGKGYATEALKETINYLFYRLNKQWVIASIDPRNKKSVELFERLGFRKEAHFKESLLIHGEWVDDLIYAILKDEWAG